ncbi:MAG: ATP-dependent sacrificial sulfur transferase LarE, partial [Syntrophomonadaceae bacterium]|nr:ATP-dependent sacrificial sulfur transferase LarE [Syntrophomonadaceae bacterium]
AVTIDSELHTAAQTEAALACAAALGARHRLVAVSDLEQAEFRANRPDRCYLCKRRRFGILKDIARQSGLSRVVDGTSASDEGDFRPGRRALQELAIDSPLRDAGLTREEIRAAARALGVPGWDRPSESCLATRIPYGTAISGELLAQVAAAEEAVRECGFRTVRVRHHGPVARIELEPAELERALHPPLRARLLEGVRRAGYVYVALDLQGYRTGAMNEVLDSPAAGKPLPPGPA